MKKFPESPFNSRKMAINLKNKIQVELNDTHEAS